jgi:hypothetical protein
MHTVVGEPSSELVDTSEAAFTVRFGLLQVSVPSSHWSTVQLLPSTHAGVPPVQAPVWQVSPMAQNSVSQAVPLAFGLGTQVSVPSLHAPLLQASAADEQSRAPPQQVPALHESLTVQNAPS